MTDAKPCPTCGKPPTIERSEWAWHVICHDCYDGAPDAGPQQHGVDINSRDSAVEWWNFEVDDWHEEHAP